MENKNINLSVNFNSDNMIDDLIITYKDIIDGFVYSITDVMFKSDEFTKMLKEIKKQHPDLKEFDYSRTKNNVAKKYFGENIRIYVQGNSIDMYGTFVTKTNEESLAVWDIFNKHVDIKTDTSVYMYSYSLRGNQLIEEAKELEMEELSYISKSYYPYIDTSIMFDQFFTGSENILLLAGPPGTGKSKILSLALKHASQNTDKLPYDKMEESEAIDHQFINVVSVKGVDVLGIDEFWGCLEKVKPDFVFIDDLDYMLTSRDSEIATPDDLNKNAFLDHFLTFTDGVVKNKTKFFITTNQPADDIDAALLRKGRLFDMLEFRRLTKDESLKIWKENQLSDKSFHEVFEEDGILPANLGSEIDKRLNTRIKTSTESYLKEDGISKIESAGKKRNFGL